MQRAHGRNERDRLVVRAPSSGVRRSVVKVCAIRGCRRVVAKILVMTLRGHALQGKHRVRVFVVCVVWLTINLSKPMLYLDPKRCKPEKKSHSGVALFMLMQADVGKPVSAHVIVLGNEKGGSGKSTTAMHVAVALLQAGQRVATIDLDSRQHSFTHYIENRRDWAARAGVKLNFPSITASRAASACGSRRSRRRSSPPSPRR